MLTRIENRARGSRLARGPSGQERLYHEGGKGQHAARKHEIPRGLVPKMNTRSGLLCGCLALLAGNAVFAEAEITVTGVINDPRAGFAIRKSHIYWSVDGLAAAPC